jgi:Kef-type K+ transport system membrane component KefB
MTFSTSELASLLLALALLLVAAHGCGTLFARLRQPRVIGEILGGLVLGPTVFGAIAPGLQAAAFPASGASASVLAAVYQLGLVLLMFSAGAEIRTVFHRGERATACAITATGILLPFLAGLAFLQLWDMQRFHGPAPGNTAFVLVFAVAIAVTSIPVISRIMCDLGILETPFARIVLAAAVIEDIVLYVVLAVALGLAATTQGEDFGLAQLVGLAPGSAAGVGYHTIVTLAFFGVILATGPRLYASVLRWRYNPIQLSSPVAFQLLFMVVVTGTATFLGITPMFGAFLAGMVVGASGAESDGAKETIKTFSFALFVPVYFAIVGLKLNLLNGFDPMFFVAFAAFACAAKALSVYAGARFAGETRAGSGNLAVAMNARGGPGIVLASVAFDAGIIDKSFYAVLVLLAILTSLLAGSWLQFLVAAGRPLLPRTVTPVAAPAEPSRPGSPAAVPQPSLPSVR